jgi:hypothetical protein
MSEKNSKASSKIIYLGSKTKGNRMRIFLALKRKGIDDTEKIEVLFSVREIIMKIMRRNYTAKLYKFVRHYLEEKAKVEELGVGEYQILGKFYGNLEYVGFLLSLVDVALELQNALFAYELTLSDIFKKLIELLLLISDEKEKAETKREIKKILGEKKGTLPLLYKLYILDWVALIRLVATLKNILDLLKKGNLSKEDEEKLKELLYRLEEQLLYAYTY